MGKDIFEHIKELEDKQVDFTAGELMLLLVGVSADLVNDNELTTQEQKKALALMGTVMELIVKHPDVAKEEVEKSKKALEKTEKIAKAFEDKTPKEAIMALLEELL